MDIRFQTGGPAHWKADAVISFLFEDEKPEQSCPLLIEAAPWLGIAPAWRDFKGRREEQVMLYGPAAMDVSRVLSVGLGKEDSLDLTDFRYAAGRAVRQCREYGLKNIGVDVRSLTRVAAILNTTPEALVRETVISCLLSLYVYDRWKSVAEKHQDPRWMALLLSGEYVEDSIRDAARMAEAEAAGIVLARDMANDPANIMTPSALAQKAHETAMRHGMSFHSLDREALQAERMNAFLAVAKGSEEQPCMAVIEYTPKGTENCKPVVLVGKGLCFDSGGISLKPAKGMEEMKGDMSGAAAVLGVMEALGQLSGTYIPRRPIIGIMACAENMPGGHATRPGDIILSRSGKSIEIVNTDAEGRLVLADVLDWAQDRYHPQTLIDIATLTGACAVALGPDSAGLFSNNDNLAAALHEAGMQLGERNWRLPLWTKTSLKTLKSPCADMVNSGIREGGAIHAAVFLQQFIHQDPQWAHIDMAAADNTESPINARGATGFGVRTLLSAVWGREEQA